VWVATLSQAEFHKIAFTGSLEVGLDIPDQAKGMVRKVSLELVSAR
jgi:acyl-CoA reductase-like NAD-dependent aldehyde dehydrogenase